MFDKEQVRQRFLEEVERLVKDGVARSYAKVAEGCGLQSYHLSDVRTGRSDLSLPVLANFVHAYRPYGVSYGYILDGEREKPAVPQEALQALMQAMEKIETAHQALTK